jgi:hypothetical protein
MASDMRGVRHLQQLAPVPSDSMIEVGVAMLCGKVTGVGCRSHVVNKN